MLGCVRRAAILASLMNISTNCGSSLWLERIFLTTTVRSKPAAPSREARNTSAMPPRPRRAVSVYCPNRCGEHAGTAASYHGRADLQRARCRDGTVGALRRDGHGHGEGRRPGAILTDLPHLDGRRHDVAAAVEVD